MKCRVLLTCVGGTLMPDLLLSLKKDPVLSPFLIGIDASEKAAGRFFVDAFHQTPMGHEKNYVEAVLKIVAQEQATLVLPCSDQEAFRLAAAEERLREAGAVLVTSPASILELIQDKGATYRTLEKAGLRVPAYVVASSFTELKTALREFGYPERSLVIKPTQGRGGRGFHLLIGKNQSVPDWLGSGQREMRHETPPSEEELLQWVSSPQLVMPLLNAPAYDVDVLADHGKARAALVRRRNNPTGIPFTGNRIVSDPNIRNYSLEIAEALQLDSLHDLDLMTDDEGLPCLLEVNPRPSGSVAAAHAAGYPVMAAVIAQKLKIDYPLKAPERDIDVGVIPRTMALPSL